MIALVLGGARSGKSAVAEGLCGPGPVTYVATGVVRGDDPDFAARVARHRERRPAGWTTVEAAGDDLVGVITGLSGTVLLDSLGLAFDVDGDELCAALTGRDGDTVVVSDEVGLGVHPSSEAGRLFRDRIGELNQQVAAISDRVLLVVAGRVVPLDRPAP